MVSIYWKNVWRLCYILLENQQWSIVNSEWKLLNKEWFSWFDKFVWNYLIVSRNKKNNILTKDWKILFKDWKDNIVKIVEDSFLVEENKKFYLKDINDKKIISDSFDWFSEYIFEDFPSKFFSICKDGERNLLNSKWEYVLDKWSNLVIPFWYNDEWTIPVLNLKWQLERHFGHYGYSMNRINPKWEILFKTWYEHIDYWKNWLFIVTNNSRDYNLVDIKGNELFDKFYTLIDSIYWTEDFLIIKNNNKSNIINSHWKIISKKWFDKIEYQNNWYFKIYLNGKTNFMNKDWKMILKKFNYFKSYNNWFFILEKKWHLNIYNEKLKKMTKKWFNCDYIYFIDKDNLLLRKNKLFQIIKLYAKQK